MKKAYLITAFFICSLQSFSQSGFLTDGIRFSENFYGSTARNAGIGSASSSLGGDLGSISINPASLGVYRSSEFVFTPVMNSVSTKSTFNGNTNKDLNYYFSLDNIGLAMNFKGITDGLAGFSLAFGYNKLNDFNNKYTIKSTNNNVSFSDYLISYANNTAPANLDDYWEGIAFDAYIIDTLGGGGYNYYSPFSGKNLNVNHNFDIKGNLGEYYSAFGVNISNKVYLGLSLNIRSGYYEESFDHTEVNPSNGENFTFSYYRNSYYRAFNAKFGAIIRPLENLRVGLSFHTPTKGTITLDIDSKARAYTLQSQENLQVTPEVTLEDEIDLTSPWRGVAGISYMFGQRGLLSFDYEYADYHAMNFSESYYNYTADDVANEDVKNNFKSTHNIRIGGEIRHNSLYLRGGFAYYSSPYASVTINKNANTNIYSGGIGYRSSGFFADLSYSLKTNSSYYLMYDLPTLPAATLKSNAGSYLLTLGFRF